MDSQQPSPYFVVNIDMTVPNTIIMITWSLSSSNTALSACTILHRGAGGGATGGRIASKSAYRYFETASLYEWNEKITESGNYLA